LENVENSLLYQVSPQAATVLKTINPSFDLLNNDSAGAISEQEIQTINAFCELFAEKNEHLFFKAQDFIQSITHFDPQQQQQKWQQDKNQVDKELQRLKHRIEQDSGHYKDLTPQKLIEQKIAHKRYLICHKNPTISDYHGKNRYFQTGYRSITHQNADLI